MAGYLGSTPVPQATQHRESFTATAAQTTFATAGYTVGFVDVYLNGVHLTPADVTATNGSDVVLGACLVNDIVDVISHSAFELNAQTFTGTTTMDVVTATGVVTANGGAVFNEGSADVDFRVESDNQTHALFVQGSDGFVGINIAAPTAPLHIQAADNADLLRFTVSGQEVWAFKGASVSKPTTGNDTISFGIAGGNQAMTWDELGICTKPLQPAFLCRPTNQQDNFAIGATTPVVFGTEVFDTGGNFASNTFTAPVTGKYQFSTLIYLLNADTVVGFYQPILATSNRTYSTVVTTSSYASDIPYTTISQSVLADMDAGDTASIGIQSPNQGTAQADVHVSSYFSGILLA